MKYRCLILDHDDTAVKSTAEIHYPAHVEVIRVLRPHLQPISLNEWFLKNFTPGIMEYLTEELGFKDKELQIEYRIWREFTTRTIPHFYPGFKETLMAFTQQGGIVTVVSHSERDIIERDYRAWSEGEPLIPNMIHGWSYDEQKRKPSPLPVKKILKQFGLREDDALIVDDLKPGVLMAQASGVAVAAAGWGHSIPAIRDYMVKHCITYFETIDQFRSFILS